VSLIVCVWRVACVRADGEREGRHRAGRRRRAAGRHARQGALLPDQLPAPPAQAKVPPHPPINLRSDRRVVCRMCRVCFGVNGCAYGHPG
jgi:hypothetical protein